MAYKKKSDDNQQEIMDALRRLGVSVVSIHRLGGGIPDLLVGFRGRTFIFEVKNPEYNCALTPDEVKFADDWKGQYAIITTWEEAWDVIKEELGDKW